MIGFLYYHLSINTPTLALNIGVFHYVVFVRY